MEKPIQERLNEIEEGIDDEEGFTDEIIDTHILTVEDSGVEGQYHFWVDLGGFCRGDATKEQIKIDCILLKVKDEYELYLKLNDIFCNIYKKLINN